MHNKNYTVEFIFEKVLMVGFLSHIIYVCWLSQWLPNCEICMHPIYWDGGRIWMLDIIFKCGKGSEKKSKYPIFVARIYLYSKYLHSNIDKNGNGRYLKLSYRYKYKYSMKFWHNINMKVDVFFICI